MHLTSHCTEAGLEGALSQRFAIVNIWQPLSIVESDPLGMVEFPSTMPADVQTISHTVNNEQWPVRQMYYGLYNPKHRWVYYPAMTPSECLLLKTFDSSGEPGIAKFALHAAFALPGQTTARESVEVRCLVFFGELEAGFGDNFTPPPGMLSSMRLVPFVNL